MWFFNKVKKSCPALLGLFFILMIHNPLTGQEAFTPSKKATKQFEKARSLFMGNKSMEALNEVAEIVEKYPEYIEAWILMADLYHATDDPENEILAWKQVIQISPSFFKNSYFFLAEAYLEIGDYQNALDQLEQFILFEKISEKLRTKSEKLKEQCTFAIEGKMHPLPFSPVRLEGINTNNDEYWPWIQTDGQTMVYTQQKQLGDNKLGDEDFFYSEKKGALWNPGQPVQGDINTNWNEGAQCVSADGKWMYFTACDRPDGKGQCDIYVSRKIGNKWTKAHNLGAPVNTASWESNPSLSADGRTLYFAAKRRDGKGKIDLYQASFFKFNSQGFPQFHEVKNLGENINTTFDELAPFIHPDGRTLFFTSFGHLSYGGADLFKSVLSPSGKWSVPENLGYPINTHKNEIGLIVDAAGKFAYFSSNREESKGRDIFQFEIPEQLKPTPVTYALGVVTGNNRPLKASVIVKDLNDTTFFTHINSDAENGEFLVCLPVGKEYLFNVTARGFLMHSRNLNLSSVFSAENPYLFNIELDSIVQGKSVILKNIFFKTNSHKLLPKSENELQTLIRFLNENPTVHIEIGGHTDNRGTIEYNLHLSEKRAYEVYIYLIKEGIPGKRLSYKGYGFEFPVADNKTEKGRAQNRRTEFIVN